MSINHMLINFRQKKTCWVYSFIEEHKILALLNAKRAANMVSRFCDPICTIPTVENYFSLIFLSASSG